MPPAQPVTAALRSHRKSHRSNKCFRYSKRTLLIYMGKDTAQSVCYQVNNIMNNIMS